MRRSTVVKILVLIPICFALSAGWVLATQLLAGASLAGSTRTYRAKVGVIIAHLDAPVSSWDIRTSYFGDLTAQEAIFHLDVVSISVWRDRFSDQPTVKQSLEIRVTGVSGNGDMGTRIVRSAFDREFGPEWNRLTHPELMSLVVPLVESDAIDGFSPRNSLTPPRVTSRLSSTSPLVLEWTEVGPRINWFGATVGWTVLLCSAFSIAVVFYALMSKERRARRWVAMKCPECGYERQRDRGECPECGFVYERPSYVVWDPTEEAASARDGTPSTRPSPDKFSEGGEGGNV